MKNEKLNSFAKTDVRERATTSQQRLWKTLNHESVDRVCIDFGATYVTGISASTLSKLRQAVLGERLPGEDRQSVPDAWRSG